MKDRLFHDLLASIKEMKAVEQGHREPIGSAYKLRIKN